MNHNLKLKLSEKLFYKEKKKNKKTAILWRAEQEIKAWKEEMLIIRSRGYFNKLKVSNTLQLQSPQSCIPKS